MVHQLSRNATVVCLINEAFRDDECISPGPDLFGLPVSTEDAFVDELEDAGASFGSNQDDMRASDLDSGVLSSGAGYLYPLDRTPQRISRSRGSSPGPSFAVVPLHPSQSNPEMRSIGPPPGYLPIYLQEVKEPG